MEQQRQFDELDDLFTRRNLIQTMLQSHVCEVTFTKVDGSKRVMPCTLKPGSFPVVESTTPAKPRGKRDDNISVWCTDQQSWRSFKLMNVTQIKILE
jgi:hypothetical protein